MLSFEEYSIDEANYTSNHKKTPSEMAILHRNVLLANKSHIIHHETDGNGNHTIVHMNQKGKVRVSNINHLHDVKGYKSTISDRPATKEETEKYGKK